MEILYKCKLKYKNKNKKILINVDIILINFLCSYYMYLQFDRTLRYFNAEGVVRAK